MDCPYESKAIDGNNILQPPSAPHIFGTDDLGHDILSHSLWGGWTTLTLALGMVVISVCLARWSESYPVIG